MVSFQILIFGVVIGAYISLAAVGFSLIYSLVNMFNIAHGEYMTIGGYMAFLGITQLQLSYFPALIVGVALSAVIGLILAKIFYEPLYSAGAIPLLLTSIGLSFFARNIIRLAFGSGRKYIEDGPTGVYRFDALGGFFIQDSQLIVIGLAALAFLSLYVLLTRTELGIAMRATSNNESLAKVTGISTTRIRDYVWLIASAFAGLAGILLAQQRVLQPAVGFNEILIVLAASLLGGGGNVYQTIGSGFLLGIVSAFASSLLPAELVNLSTAVIFLVLFFTLLFRSHIVEAEAWRA
jgi:branched-subunit amino acid ABC-type transport system permease component